MGLWRVSTVLYFTTKLIVLSFKLLFLAHLVRVSTNSDLGLIINTWMDSIYQ